MTMKHVMNPSDAGQYSSSDWLLSPEVTAFCNKAKQEREQRFAKKECACGNECHTDYDRFDDEYVCKECR